MAKFDDDTRLKLIGLKALATDCNNRLEESALATKLCGESPDEFGLASDFIYDNAVSIEDLERRAAREAN